MPISRRHHYLSQMQQRPFASDGKRERIWVFDKETGEVQERKIEKLAVSLDYYTVETPGGEKHDNLEQTFARAESEAARVLQSVREKKDGPLGLSAEEREWLLILVAISRARVPTQRDASEEIAEMLARAALGNAARSKDFVERARAAGVTGSDEDIEAFRERLVKQLEAGEVEIVADPAHSLLAMAQEMLVALPFLAERRLTVLKRTKPPQLVISDNPVVLRGPDEKAPVGYATPGVRILLPLAPDTLLAVSDEKGDEEIRTAGEDEFRDVTFAVWRQASRYVFAPHRDELEAIAKELGERAREQAGRIVFGGWLPGDPVREKPAKAQAEAKATPSNDPRNAGGDAIT